MNYYTFLKNSYNVKTKSETFSSKGLSGLFNIGNKCYINSIIQCLSNTLVLTDYIITNDYKKDLNRKVPKNNVDFMSSFVNLIIKLWASNDIIKPMSFIENFGFFHKQYLNRLHQDSHECLLYLLDLLHECLKYDIEMDFKQTKNKVVNDCYTNWYSIYKDNYSKIVELFHSFFINTVKCSKCKYLNYTFEPSSVLSLSILESSKTIYDCLNDFFKEETVVSKCNCKKETSLTKSTKIINLSNFLIIHLKDKHSLSFPLENLDMTPYISDLQSNTNNYIYDLYAVCSHIGDTESGHYYSVCKNLDNHWYIYNDANVQQINDMSLLNQIVNTNAYILFYYRKFEN